MSPTADAHIHIFGEGWAGPLGSSPAGDDELSAYERLRAHHGIERALVIGYEGGPRYAGNNAEIFALARERKWMVPLAYIPPQPPPAVSRLRELEDCGAAGIALFLPSAADGQRFDAWPTAAVAQLRERPAIVSLNASPTATAAIERRIGQLDGCAVLFSHLGLPGRYPRPPGLREARAALGPLLALAKHPHVGVKISGMYAVSEPAHDFPHLAAQPFIDLLLEAFEPARLYWGSDFAPALDFVSFEQTADCRLLAGCSSKEIHDIMGGNLLRNVAGCH